MAATEIVRRALSVSRRSMKMQVRCYMASRCRLVKDIEITDLFASLMRAITSLATTGRSLPE